VLDVHAQRAGASPDVEVITELAVLVALRALLQVFFPKKLEGDTFFPQLLDESSSRAINWLSGIPSSSPSRKPLDRKACTYFPTAVRDTFNALAICLSLNPVVTL
jgi:hypothetical protein